MNDLAYLNYSNPDDKHEEKQQFFFYKFIVSNSKIQNFACKCQ